MEKKLAFLVDMDRCIGCSACALACKNEYQQEPYIRWRKVYFMPDDTFEQPIRACVSLACNHCEDPACMKACPAGAYEKRADGIVAHIEEACIGCKMCMLACPYRVPSYNHKTGKVEKCDMCAKRQDAGLAPACVAGCPMDAIRVVDLNAETPASAVDTIKGFPDIGMTRPTTRFIKPRIGAQVRSDDK